MDPLIECEEESNCELAIKLNSPLIRKLPICYEKCKVQSNNNKEQFNGVNNDELLKIEETSQEYDELPAGPEERYNFFTQEYNALLRDIKEQNKVTENFFKLSSTELKSYKDKNSQNQLKSSIETECAKLDGLTLKALRIQNLYPNEDWEPLPQNNHKEELTTLISNMRKTKVSCQTTATIKSSSTKTISRTSSTTSTTSMQSRKSNYTTTEKSKQNQINMIRKSPSTTSANNTALRERNSISSMRSKENCYHTKNNICNNCRNNIYNNGTKDSTSATKLNANKEQINSKYTELMDVLRYKESELENMLNTLEQNFESHLKKHMRPAEGDNNNTNIEAESNIKYLQRKVSVLQLEQNDFRRKILSQQEDIKKYHQRFVDQKKAIDSLEANNKNMENDINAVITNLKETYESKLRELSSFPQLLKIEKRKLESVSRDKREIETKFNMLAKEFENLKQKLDLKSKKITTTSNDRIKYLKRELQVCKNFNTALKDERDRLSNELHRSKSELDHFRAESNKIIFRTRDQAETQRRIYQKKINELQSELLTNRASNTCFIKQRNKLVDDMQSQLCNLKENFQLSHTHMENLKTHLSSLSMTGPQSTRSETFIK